MGNDPQSDIHSRRGELLRLLLYLHSMQTVDDLVAQIVTYDLEAPPMFWHTSLEDLERLYNGIGPDWLPKSIREAMTAHWGFYAPAALVHDYEYAMSEDRSFEAFTAANERMRRNCYKLNRKGYPWYKRWLYQLRSDKLADACQTFGWGAWNEASRGRLVTSQAV
jgi:hypothetical protein